MAKIKQITTVFIAAFMKYLQVAYIMERNPSVFHLSDMNHIPFLAHASVSPYCKTMCSPIL